MKQLTFSIICIFLITFFACTKDPAPPAPPPPAEEKPIIELGRISMVKEGKTWSYPARAYNQIVNNKKETIISYKIIDNALEETLVISDVPNRIGKYKVEFDWPTNDHNLIPQADISWVLDVDQLIGVLRLDTTRQDNWLEIIRFDSTKQIYEGRFEMHLKKYLGAMPLGLPSKIDLTDGKFHVQIKQ